MVILGRLCQVHMLTLSLVCADRIRDNTNMIQTNEEGGFYWQLLLRETINTPLVCGTAAAPNDDKYHFVSLFTVELIRSWLVENVRHLERIEG